MSRRIIINISKLVFGVGLFAFVIWKNWAGIGQAFTHPIQWTPLTIAAAFYVVGLFSTFIRWYFLVRAQDMPFTRESAMRIGLIGFSLNTLLPGSIGGDLVKAAFLAREQSRRTVAVATVLLDRIIGLWGLVWLVSMAGGLFMLFGDAALTADATVRGYILTMFGVAGGSLAFWFLLGALPQQRSIRFAGRLASIPKIGHSLAEFWRAFWLYRCKSRAVLGAVILSMFNHTCLVFAFYFCAQVFLDPTNTQASNPTLAQHFLLVPLAMLIQTIPLSPGGVGVGEFVFGKLYEIMGYAEANGVLGAVAMRLVILGLAMVGYVIYLRMKPSLPVGAIEEIEEEDPVAELKVDEASAPAIR